MKKILKEVKETPDSSLEADNFKVTYDPSKEVDSIATYGPWSIEGNTTNISSSGINTLGAILDGIREIESE